MDLAGRRVGQRRYTDIDNVRFVLRSVYKYDRALLGLAALNAVFSSITHFVPILMPKLVNDQLTTGGAPGTVLAIVAVFSAALCVSASIAQTAGNWLSHRFIVVRLRLIAESGYKFMTMDFQNLEDRKVLDMAQRGDRACNNNADGVEGVMHRLLSSSSRVIVLTGATAVITLLHPLLLLAIAALIAINYSVSTRARRLDKAINVGLAKVWRRVNHISGVMSNFDYGKDIRLFGMKDFLLARYGDEQQRLNDGNRRLERVWLHQRQGDEWGWSAWSLEHLGFATWAPTREEMLERVPVKLAEYGEWLARHGERWDATPQGPLEVVEEIAGNEVVFRDDLLPASVSEIERCQRLLGYTRSDLLQTVASLLDVVLDWDPPYAHFAPGAWWRTIRQILRHIALTEAGYYLPSVGWQPKVDLVALRTGSWEDLLHRTREETLRFLEALKGDADKVRLNEVEETWSVRKMLRWLAWHERLHWKSIRRILAEYAKLGR